MIPLCKGGHLLETTDVLNCEKFELIQPYLGGALEGHELLAFEQHLSGCQACKEQIEEHAQVVSLWAKCKSEGPLQED